MGRVVGIDLGTTNSVVAVMEGGKPVVIANAEGMRTTPSVVGFNKEEERLVGQMARRQSVLDPQNTFYGVKRFIGRKYGELNPDSKQVPYTIRKDEIGNIKVRCPRLKRDFAPEEISALVLQKLVDEASRYLGEPVTGAVITVPAYFNDSQRQATRDAGRIAGLDVKRILNEPTAASLAYGLDRAQSEIILVFDLGGGTFDVSVLEVGDGVFEVKATSGDTQLGGGDFDQKIVDFLADQFLAAEGIDLRQDRQSLQRLTEAAEKAKIELSGVTVTEINLPFITATADGPKHIETRMTRSQFEGLCGELLSRLRAPVKQAVRDAGLPPSAIDEIVLVGGGTRMPMVQELVRSLINRAPNQNVNPDEVVAVGAAIQAGILAGEVKDILLLDVTPLSLGLETIGGVMKQLIPRNTTIPVRRSDIFSTGDDNQTMVEVHVVQGEREMASGNKSLGRFKLMGIPPAPRGIPQVQVAFDIDANGILQVTAMDRTTGREQTITVQGASNLSEDEVRQMVRNAEEFAQSDRLRKEKVEKRNKAEAMTFQSERLLREATLDFGVSFVSPYRSKIDALSQRLRESLANNDDRGIDILSGNLRDAIADLNREVYQRNQDEAEEGGFFNSIKSFFLDDEDDDYYYDNRRDPRNPRDPYDGWGTPRREPYDDWDNPRRDSYDNQPRRDGYDDRISRRDPYDNAPRRDPYDDRAPRRDPYDNAPRRDPYNDPAPRRDGYDDRLGNNAPQRDPYADPPARRDAPAADRPRRDSADAALRRDDYTDRRDSYEAPAPRREPTESWGDEPPRRTSRESNQDLPRRPVVDNNDRGDRPRRPRPADNSDSGTKKRPSRPNYNQDNWDDEDDWL